MSQPEKKALGGRYLLGDERIWFAAVRSPVKILTLLLTHVSRGELVNQLPRGSALSSVKSASFPQRVFVSVS